MENLIIVSIISILIFIQIILFVYRKILIKKYIQLTDSFDMYDFKKAEKLSVKIFIIKNIIESIFIVQYIAISTFLLILITK